MNGSMHKIGVEKGRGLGWYMDQPAVISSSQNAGGFCTCPHQLQIGVCRSGVWKFPSS